MDKETKELLKRTLSMTDDKLLLKFAKSYAAKDPAFAEAIIEKFLPKEDNVDYDKMVKDCFLHKKKGRLRRYGPSLDWAAIRRDIKRLIKQLNFLRQQNGAMALETAVLFLETLAEEFIDDRVYEDERYDNSNFGNNEALDIISDLLQNDNAVTRDQKLDFVKRLKRLSKSSVYSSYLYCGIDKVVDNANQLLLPPDDFLKEIDSNIISAKYNTDKAYYVKWKINLLRQLGRDNEAEKNIQRYLSLDEISAMKFEQLVAGSHFKEAKAFCLERIKASTDDRSRNTQSWQERLLELSQQTNDVKTVREVTRSLFTNGNVAQDDKKEFYRICRETFEPSNWPPYRDKMLSDGKKGNVSVKTVFQLYEEEQLFDRMYLYLQKLPDTMGSHTWDSYTNSGGERLYFFSSYARCFTEKQRKEMVAAFAKTILKNSKTANDRFRYRQIASGLNLLGISCEEGKKQASALVVQIIRENPTKPAFREELEQYGL